MIQEDNVAYASLVEPPKAALPAIFASAAAPNAAALQESDLLELFAELAQRKVLIAKVTIAAMAIEIAPEVTK
jgi:hypothetical protein